MADQTPNPETPTTASVPTERGDSAADLCPNNLDPSKGRVGLWISFRPQTAREKATVFNAVTGSCKTVESMIGETIMLQNVVIQGVELTNAVTGEVKPAIRTVLIDTSGKCYAAVSDGIHKAVKNLIGFAGMPPYEEGIPVMPTKTKAKVGHFYSLEMVAPEQEEPAKPAPKPAPPPPKK